jgi:hypothetical protein
MCDTEFRDRYEKEEFSNELVLSKGLKENWDGKDKYRPPGDKGSWI